MKECAACREIKPLEEFRDAKLLKGYGRICFECKLLKKFEQLERTPAPPDRVDKPVKKAVLSEKKCPRCGAQMVVRERRSDQKKFYGCSRFPRCKGTRPS
jgi:predicted RNA-binding Zn-ribbon protein involved in translation (DUF1610 family)